MNKITKIFEVSPILSSLILIVLAAIAVIAYRLEEFIHIKAMIEHPIIIENIKIDKEGNYIWKVPNGTWNSRKGEGRVSLVIDRDTQMRGKELDRAKRPLKLKIEVYSLKKNGTRIDRLIRNWYFTTDEPFSEAGSNLWSSGDHYAFEYGLAGILAYPRENVFIHLQVIHPDIELSMGNPRLKITGDYDYATVPFVDLFIMGFFGILVLLIVVFSILICIILMKDEILSET